MSMTQYLDRYAEPEADLEPGPGYRYDHVLCIPAFDEPADFLGKTVAGIHGARGLVILVVNAPASASPGQIERTRQLALELEQRTAVKSRLAKNITLRDGPGLLDLLLVERCNPGRCLPDKDGVGLARKIACDIACRLIATGTVKSPWIHTTDADASLPANYLETTRELDPARDSAGIYPFRHAPARDEKVRDAQARYDLAMDYYVEGLAWAGSPWAFHTIGSTLVVNAGHYAMARGFPRRQAGEDFYLLNKLGKIGNIVSLPGPAVTLESRLSARVPFGTGPALQNILALQAPASDYLYYNPRCFVALKCWLELARLLRPETGGTLETEFIDRFIEDRLEFSQVDSLVLLACLKALGVDRALTHASSNSTSKAVFDRHLQNWFDAFQTLKFIHWLRDLHYPSLPLDTIREQRPGSFTAAMNNGLQGPPGDQLTPG